MGLSVVRQFRIGASVRQNKSHPLKDMSWHKIRKKIGNQRMIDNLGDVGHIGVA